MRRHTAGGPRLRVAFQGEPGAYSEAAVDAHWRGAAQPTPARECDDVARAVAGGAADGGLLAVENTLAGHVLAAYDALLDEGIVPVGEVVLPINHCVLALPGARLEALVAVESHPIALAQCRAFLRRHPHVEPRAAYDTAGAARALAERGDARVAAIAGRAAARRYGLEVLAANVEDRADNRTRFVAVAPAAAAAPHAPAPGTAARTMLVATPGREPDALARLLRPFADAGLAVGAPVPRPGDEPWAYRVVLEVAHAAGDPRLDAAVDAARGAARALRVLGTFARAAEVVPGGGDGPA